MIKLSRMMVAVAAVFSLQAHADMVIDDFTIGQFAAVDTTANGVGVWTASTAGHFANIIGGQRDIFVNKEPCVVSGTVTCNATGPVTGSASGDGTFRFSQDSDVAGTGLLRWDGTNTGASVDKTGLGGVMLMDAGNQFVFDFKSDASNPATPFLVTIDIWDMLSRLATVQFETENTFGTYANGYVGFGEFTLDVGFDWNNIGAMQVGFNTNTDCVITATNPSCAAIDVDITVKQVNLVPEPASLALTGLALLGLGAVRRNRKA